MTLRARSRIAALLIATAAAGCAGTREGDAVARAQRTLAHELVRQRSWARAFAVADELCRADPEDAEARYLRGIALAEQGLELPAATDLEEAVRLDDGHAAAHSALGTLYDRQRRPREGLEHHRRASDLDPRNPAYLNNLGFSLFAHGRARDAVPVLERAVGIAPADGRVRNNLGFAWAAAGDLTRAAAEFDLAGPPAQARNNLGWAYEQRGMRERARELYAEAAALDPAAAKPRENLDRLSRDLGRPAAPAPGASQ
jgi:tetratricopeptide (TPR) repeat protein